METGFPLRSISWRKARCLRTLSLERGSTVWWFILTSYCGTLSVNRRTRQDRAQPVRIRWLQAVLKEAGDPDWKGMKWFAKGIRVGVGVRLPRTPAVFARKRKWRLPEQMDRNAWREPSTESAWRDSYRSAKCEQHELERQRNEMSERDLCFEVGSRRSQELVPRTLRLPIGRSGEGTDDRRGRKEGPDDPGRDARCQAQ